jgi:hypothetical protein
LGFRFRVILEGRTPEGVESTVAPLHKGEEGVVPDNGEKALLLLEA